MGRSGASQGMAALLLPYSLYLAKSNYNANPLNDMRIFQIVNYLFFKIGINSYLFTLYLFAIMGAGWYSFWQSPISSARLNPLRDLHLRPIKLMVSERGNWGP